MGGPILWGWRGKGAKTMIWTYWEGPRLRHIELCLATLRKVYGDDLCIVTPETLPDYMPEDLLHPRWREIPEIGPKVCCLRAALIYSAGGWWFDADTIGIRKAPPTPIADFVYATWNNEPFRVLSGYFGARAESPIVYQWIEGINRLLSEEFDEIGRWWLTFGEDLLTPIIEVEPMRVREVPLKRWLPVDFDADPFLFVCPGASADYIKPSTICCGLNNSWLAARVRSLLEMPEEQQAQSGILIHNLLNKAREIASS